MIELWPSTRTAGGEAPYLSTILVYRSLYGRGEGAVNAPIPLSRDIPGLRNSVHISNLPVTALVKSAHASGALSPTCVL